MSLMFTFRFEKKKKTEKTKVEGERSKQSAPFLACQK